MCPADELALLRACLRKPADVSDLSRFHNPLHMLDVEKLGYLARSDDRHFYSLTEKGKARCQQLADLLDARLYAAQQQAEHAAQQKAHQDQSSFKAEKDKRQKFRHDFAVAVFTAALTLISENLVQFVQFLQPLFHW